MTIIARMTDSWLFVDSRFLRHILPPPPPLFINKAICQASFSFFLEIVYESAAKGLSQTTKFDLHSDLDENSLLDEPTFTEHNPAIFAILPRETAPEIYESFENCRKLPMVRLSIAVNVLWKILLLIWSGTYLNRSVSQPWVSINLNLFSQSLTVISAFFLTLLIFSSTHGEGGGRKLESSGLL